MLFFRVKIFCLVLAVSSFLTCKTSQQSQQSQESKYIYETVANDPLNARIYTLDNGLKIYLTVNKREPRVQTYIAVKAGSKSDPKETTGLAHYLEHMLFKGTADIGTLDFEAEKVLLDSISILYEQHKASADPQLKSDIYKKIDSLSTVAARYAIPNEYDKMISSLGAKRTNAYTSVEQTVYVNDIPSNELEKWLLIESNRFRTLVLRLFHTELETVYEEFNRAQDNDFRKAYYALMEGLFPNHPYGTQTTLGEGEHLKNPSLKNIHNYFNSYYVPNNIAICLSGDLDPEKTVTLIEKYFGDWQPKEVPQNQFPNEPPLTQPVKKEVLGPQRELVYVGFRFAGAKTQEAMLMKLVNEILYNQQAGLIDLNLNQKQKVLTASAFAMTNAEYSAHILSAEPRGGQSLDDVKDLLLAEIEKIKKGEFENWMIEAAVKNLKLSQIRGSESNVYRTNQFVASFTDEIPWIDMVNELNKMALVTKEDIIKFANEHYKNNYVVVFKRTGEDKNIHKVEKPLITPLTLNRDTQSAFFSSFDTIESERIQPIFVDYKNDITIKKLNEDLEYYFVKNNYNELFELYYIFDMGTDNSRELGIAVKYLPYLGTDKYTAEQLQQEFFKRGLSFDVFSSKDQIYVTLNGLEESLEEGVKLFEHVLHNAQPDSQALKDLVDGILKERTDAKKDKGRILQGAMVNYAKYGPVSSFTNILSESELRALEPQPLVKMIHDLGNYRHRIFYYGTDSKKGETSIKKFHRVPENFKDYPPAKNFPELDITQTQVYFVPYDMVQAEMVLLSKGKAFDKELAPAASLFNEYFGSGLSSIVFQEIRESKALAYAAYAAFTTPRLKDESHYLFAYIGTQADKLPNAANAMLALMNDMPKVQNQFSSAVDAAMKVIESERIVGSGIFWSYEAARKRGLDHDLRSDIYKNLQTTSLDELERFFAENIKGKKFAYLVIGKKGNVDEEVLKKIGPVKELELQTIFNY